MPLIVSVDKRSPAYRAGVRAGMRLAGVNGRAVADVLDYMFRTYDAELTLNVLDAKGRERDIRVRHGEGGCLGLTFDTALMDEPRRCRNKCVFCFIDQNPKAPGLRETLYFKDDDVRLSFLTGTYVTLTNLTGDDERRITEQRLSPLRVSVHAACPSVRGAMLGLDAGRADVMPLLRRLTRAGIAIHTQIVVCPGLNDGAHLTRTLEELHALGPRMESVSVVPAGLTKYRDGLYPLEPVTPSDARGCIGRAAAFERAYCADELYITAGLPIPETEYYGDYPQLENGVGMVRLFTGQFMERAGGNGHARPARADAQSFSIATGTAFAPFLRRLLEPYGLARRVYAVRSEFWGEGVTVAGLVTGRDLIAQLRGADLGARLLIPDTMLRHDMFLDDVTTDEAARALGAEVKAVTADGGALWDEIMRETQDV